MSQDNVYRPPAENAAQPPRTRAVLLPLGPLHSYYLDQLLRRVRLGTGMRAQRATLINMLLMFLSEDVAMEQYFLAWLKEQQVAHVDEPPVPGG